MTADYKTTITVSKTPQEAFDAINDVSGWWGRITGTPTAMGNEFVYVVPGLHYSGMQVTELEPGRSIAWLVTGSYLSFIADTQEWNGTTVRFDIDEGDDGTRITFTHEGLGPDVECYGACSNAWGTYVRGSLRDFIETGVGQPNSLEGDEALDAADHAELRRRIEGHGVIDTDAISQTLLDQ
ncbi:SRPBCC family protein [Glaciibacter superstes]|uniref:SRPBCC family protein n=1 Tax=Glaciibacter superstes TaxID=501023 RepID=UPI0003B54B49|nr:SRPBCC domain-containing protein [Glaciibacter superstes]